MIETLSATYEWDGRKWILNANSSQWSPEQREHFKSVEMNQSDAAEKQINDIVSHLKLIPGLKITLKIERSE